MKTCVLCGKPVSRGNSQFCNSEYHTYTCMFCGKQFTAPKSKNNYYYSMMKQGKCVCSRSCGFKLRYSKDTEEQKQERANKRRNMCLNKYGVSNVSKSPLIQQKKETTCMSHLGVRFPSQSDEVKSKIQDTCLRRYGEDNYFKTEAFDKKRRSTSRDLYGVDHPSRSSVVKQKIKDTCQERYGTDCPFQNDDVKAKIRKTNIKRYGVEYATQSDEVKKKIVSTNMRRFGGPSPFSSEEVKEKARNTWMTTLGVDNPSKSDKVISKHISSSRRKFGTDNPSQSDEIKYKIKQSIDAHYGGPYWSSEEAKTKYLQKTGYTHPSQNLEVRQKVYKVSSFEQRIIKILEDYHITYEVHKTLSKFKGTKDVISHEFDMYLPDHNILIDCDGTYWHDESSSKNGSIGYYDSLRNDLIPDGYRLVVIHQGEEEHAIRQLVSLLKDVDVSFDEYDTDLFRFCRSIDFPYPEYKDEQIIRSWKSLCDTDVTKLNPRSSIGNVIIKNYHKSLYDVRVGKVSTRQAWYDDGLLKKVILNRHIYLDADKQTPSRILQGFNISKIAPRASIFCPAWAKYLVTTYLDEFQEVFDPFSGFSGRLLGVASLGKKYIGQDLDSTHIEESNNIVTFLNLQNDVKLSVKDILDSTGTYDCLLTSPPYYDKEIYGNEQVFKTSEQWIDECLERFMCKKYVFVVDNPGKYSKYVVEKISHRSFMSNSCEYVVLIPGSIVEE